VPQSCGLVWNFVRSRRLAAGRHVAIYLNAAIDLEIGVEVQGAFDAEGGVVPSSTPPGLTASTVHFGPYQHLGTAHAAVRSWCEANGHQLVGPSWEIYGHWQPDWNTDPSRIRTDVFYRVTPSS
jgi:effector-binding domain-containing protein